MIANRSTGSLNRTDEDNSDYASCLDALKGKFGQAIAPIVAPVIDGNKKDLEPGQLRIRKQGSAGGHNGIKDIIRQLGTEKFLRIKVGVGAKPKGWDLADHVLGRFSTEDRKLVDEAIAKAAKAVDIIISQGTDAAMNEYNRKVPVQK